jgi:hypothetical protein
VLFAYVGPETMLPLVSVLTGVVGVFMMFGQSIGRVGSKLWRGVRPPASRK